MAKNKKRILLCFDIPGMIQGAIFPFIPHCPAALMGVEQQLLSDPVLSEQPIPPHAPQPSAQQIIVPGSYRAIPSYGLQGSKSITNILQLYP